jgi:hypothetical protein
MLRGEDIISARSANRPSLNLYENQIENYAILQTIIKNIYGNKNGIMPDVYEEFLPSGISVGNFLPDTTQWLRIPSGLAFLKNNSQSSSLVTEISNRGQDTGNPFVNKGEQNYSDTITPSIFQNDFLNSYSIFNKPNFSLYEEELANLINLDLTDLENDIKLEYFVKNKIANYRLKVRETTSTGVMEYLLPLESKHSCFKFKIMAVANSFQTTISIKDDRGNILESFSITIEATGSVGDAMTKFINNFNFESSLLFAKIEDLASGIICCSFIDQLEIYTNCSMASSLTTYIDQSYLSGGNMTPKNGITFTNAETQTYYNNIFDLTNAFTLQFAQQMSRDIGIGEMLSLEPIFPLNKIGLLTGQNNQNRTIYYNPKLIDRKIDSATPANSEASYRVLDKTKRFGITNSAANVVPADCIPIFNVAFSTDANGVISLASANVSADFITYDKRQIYTKRAELNTLFADTRTDLVNWFWYKDLASSPLREIEFTNVNDTNATTATGNIVSPILNLMDKRASTNNNVKISNLGFDLLANESNTNINIFTSDTGSGNTNGAITDLTPKGMINLKGRLRVSSVNDSVVTINRTTIGSASAGNFSFLMQNYSSGTTLQKVANLTIGGDGKTSYNIGTTSGNVGTTNNLPAFVLETSFARTDTYDSASTENTLPAPVANTNKKMTYYGDIVPAVDKTYNLGFNGNGTAANFKRWKNVAAYNVITKKLTIDANQYVENATPIDFGFDLTNSNLVNVSSIYVAHNVQASGFPNAKTINFFRSSSNNAFDTIYVDNGNFIFHPNRAKNAVVNQTLAVKAAVPTLKLDSSGNLFVKANISAFGSASFYTGLTLKDVESTSLATNASFYSSVDFYNQITGNNYFFKIHPLSTGLTSFEIEYNTGNTELTGNFKVSRATSYYDPLARATNLNGTLSVLGNTTIGTSYVDSTNNGTEITIFGKLITIGENTTNKRPNINVHPLATIFGDSNASTTNLRGLTFTIGENSSTTQGQTRSNFRGDVTINGDIYSTQRFFAIKKDTSTSSNLGNGDLGFSFDYKTGAVFILNKLSVNSLNEDIILGTSGSTDATSAKSVSLLARTLTFGSATAGNVTTTNIYGETANFGAAGKANDVTILGNLILKNATSTDKYFLINGTSTADGATKFWVQYSTGNTKIYGTLISNSDASFVANVNLNTNGSSITKITGNTFIENKNFYVGQASASTDSSKIKFTVLGASGNTTTEGNLVVKGLTNTIGTLVGTNSASVTGNSSTNLLQGFKNSIQSKTFEVGTLNATGFTDSTFVGFLALNETTNLGKLFTISNNSVVKFQVNYDTGNTEIKGTTNSVGDFSVASTKFKVVAATGNTSVAGTLTIDGEFLTKGKATIGTLGTNSLTTIYGNVFNVGTTAYPVTTSFSGNINFNSGSISSDNDFYLNNKFIYLGSTATTSSSNATIILNPNGNVTANGVLVSKGNSTLGTTNTTTATILGTKLDIGSASYLTNLNVFGDLTSKGNSVLGTSGGTKTHTIYGNTGITGTLNVSAATTLSSTANVVGDFSVNGNNFAVTASNGDTYTKGTLKADGATTLTSFTATSNGSITGTLGVTGATTLTSFTATSNGSITGTLGVTGATTLSSTANVVGNFSVNSSKFKVTASSGNTEITGTLGVTGATTLTSLTMTGNSAISGDMFLNNKGIYVGTTSSTSVSNATGYLNAAGKLRASNMEIGNTDGGVSYINQILHVRQSGEGTILLGDDAKLVDSNTPDGMGIKRQNSDTADSNFYVIRSGSWKKLVAIGDSLGAGALTLGDLTITNSFTAAASNFVYNGSTAKTIYTPNQNVNNTGSNPTFPSATITTLSSTNIASTNVYKTGTSKPESSVAAAVYGFDKVYNAVWNDIADYIIIEEGTEKEFGKVYCYDGEKHFISNKRSQKGSVGISSDTFGFGVGAKGIKNELPIAIGGFVLAHIKGKAKSGDPLVSTKDGFLTKANLFERIFLSHRILATYYKDEKKEEWGSDTKKIKVNGRKWVKVK